MTTKSFGLIDNPEGGWMGFSFFGVHHPFEGLNTTEYAGEACWCLVFFVFCS